MPRTLHPNEVRQLEIEKALENLLKAAKRAVNGAVHHPYCRYQRRKGECDCFMDPLRLAIAQAEKVARPEGGTDQIKEVKP